MTKTDQKIALITGASRGLGAATAEKLAAEGYHVIAVARTAGGLEELDDRIQAAGGSATLAPFDITDEDAIKRMCISVHERWGVLDIWVPCAIHAAPLAPASHIADKGWTKSIAVNITATGRLIANIESLLLAKSGIAVHVDDPMDGQKFFGAYGATKAAQRALFESWSRESVKTGPDVITFTPNPMPTACRARFYPGEDREPLFHPNEEAKRLIKQL